MGGGNFLRRAVVVRDLIRFGRFQDAWWTRNGMQILIMNCSRFHRPNWSQNEYLKQNPGYPDIAR